MQQPLKFCMLPVRKPATAEAFYRYRQERASHCNEMQPHATVADAGRRCFIKLKSSRMKRSMTIQIICTLLIILWVYAALSKLFEFSVFAAQLQRQPLPQWSVALLKWGLPIVELVTAVMICFQKSRYWGLLLSSGLLAVFTFYVVFALSGAFGDIPCSCAGLIAALHWKGHLLFNIIFTGMSTLGVYLHKYTGAFAVKRGPHIV